MRVGGEIAVRTTALLGVFLVASAVLARVGGPRSARTRSRSSCSCSSRWCSTRSRSPAQVMVGRMLGAGDAAGARAASRRMIGWSVASARVFALVLLALGDVLPRAFTDDPAVIEQAQEIWPLFAAMMPVNGAVFALDGILIGAGDTRFLAWGMLAASAVSSRSRCSRSPDWGIVGVWAGSPG